MKPIKFWLPMNGYEQEIIIPGEYVESIIVPAAEHEAGHIVTAHHLNARVIAIAIGFVAEQTQQGMFLQALYGWKNSTVETKCVVKAAGPAADILFTGKYDEAGARGDLQDIEALTGLASLEPYLEKAKSILAGYTSEVGCIKKALRSSLELEEDRTLIHLPSGHMGAVLLDDLQLMRCLTKNSGQAL